jgi:hypothetical protein
MSAIASHRRTAHYVVGSSDATAFSSGLNVAHVRMIAYGIGGLFAAIGGFALTGSKLSADPTTVTSYTLVAGSRWPSGAPRLLGDAPASGIAGCGWEHRHQPESRSRPVGAERSGDPFLSQEGADTVSDK